MLPVPASWRRQLKTIRILEPLAEGDDAGEAST